MRMILRPSDVTCWVGVGAAPGEVVVGVDAVNHAATCIDVQDAVVLVMAIVDQRDAHVGSDAHGIETVADRERGGFGVGFPSDGGMRWSYVEADAVNMVLSGLLDAIAVADEAESPVWGEMDRLVGELVRVAQTVGVSPWYPLSLVAAGMNNLPVEA